MKATDRQALIYDYIKKHQDVSTSHIAEYFRISPVTVRRYLDNLEKNGLISRQYGKAIITDSSKSEFSYSTRSEKNIAYKQEIAKLALPYLLKASSAFFDASSTALELLKLMPKSHTITIYAANSAVFNYLQDYPHVRLFILGGYLCKGDGITLDSEITLNVAKEIFVDATFISCAGFTEEGFFDNATTGISVKKIMLENSAHTYLLADHTKFNANSIFQVGRWDRIQTLICDSSFDAKAEQSLKKEGLFILP